VKKVVLGKEKTLLDGPMAAFSRIGEENAGKENPLKERGIEE